MEISISQEEWARELEKLTSQFVVRLKDRVRELSVLIENRQWEEAAKKAHQIAGSTASYGFKSVAKEAREIERDALKQSPERVKKNVENIYSLMEKYWE